MEQLDHAHRALRLRTREGGELATDALPDEVTYWSD
jgi:hypothetical protein